MFFIIFTKFQKGFGINRTKVEIAYPIQDKMQNKREINYLCKFIYKVHENTVKLYATINSKT